MLVCVLLMLCMLKRWCVSSIGDEDALCVICLWRNLEVLQIFTIERILSRSTRGWWFCYWVERWIRVVNPRWRFDDATDKDDIVNSSLRWVWSYWVLFWYDLLCVVLVMVVKIFVNLRIMLWCNANDDDGNVRW